jgi:hypothetical protein
MWVSECMYAYYVWMNVCVTHYIAKLVEWVSAQRNYLCLSRVVITDARRVGAQEQVHAASSGKLHTWLLTNDYLFCRKCSQ